MRLLWLALPLSLVVAGCEDRRIYEATPSLVTADGVELAIESCELWHCDFIYVITNRSEGCVAFHGMSLPEGSHVWYDETLGIARRITGSPNSWARRSFLVLQPGESLREGVSVRALTGRRDIESFTPTLSTHFIACDELDGQPSPTPLVSGPIHFTRRK